MKYKITLVLSLLTCIAFSQVKDSIYTFKKKVLDASEIDFVSSYYSQNGDHAAVSGGIGTEKLTDLASNIVVVTPLNDDDILTIDVGVSAYTSASSSNVNPFNSSSTSTGASGQQTVVVNSKPYGTPWQASSGASAQGALYSLNSSYSHASDDRNFVWNAEVSLSNEFNYSSKGIGGGITKLYNHKNTEVSCKVNAFFDNWKIIYPTELKEFDTYGSNFLHSGYFHGVTVLDNTGTASQSYLPDTFKPWDSSARNSFSASFSFSQTVSKRMQFSVFLDILQQQGKLSTPYQRIYFADKPNYYIGFKEFIPVYETPSNTGVFQLADDIERLPNKRFKLPIGVRLNYFINEKYILRTYYRYYLDDWNIQSHTLSFELPYKFNDSFTFYPMYRFYTQTASKFFAPYEQHLSTEQYYTSDYDLSGFSANQFGVGATYNDPLMSFGLFYLGLKSIDFRYNHYMRTDGLRANIVSVSFKFSTD